MQEDTDSFGGSNFTFFDKDDQELEGGNTVEQLQLQNKSKITVYSETACAGIGFGHSDPSQGFEKQ